METILPALSVHSNMFIKIKLTVGSEKNRVRLSDLCFVFYHIVCI